MMNFLDYDFRILIDGSLCKPLQGKTMNVINPANNQIVAVVPSCTAEDVELAVAAAKKARYSGKIPM